MISLKKNFKIIVSLFLVLILSGVSILFLYTKDSKKEDVQNLDVVTKQEDKSPDKVQEQIPQNPVESKPAENKPVQEVPKVQQIPDNIPTNAPADAQNFNGTPKIDIKKISESKLEKLKFTKTQSGEMITYTGQFDSSYVYITFREGRAQYLGVYPYDAAKEAPADLEHIQYADVYSNNEIAVSDTQMINKVPDYANMRRVVFYPDGNFQYATKKPDQSTVDYYEKTCNIVKQLSE